MKIEIEINDELYNEQIDKFIKVVKDMIQLYAKKNHDYGDSFNEGMDKIGLAYGIGRIYDKTNRLLNSLNVDYSIKDETVKDTAIDLANYAVMLKAWLG